MLAAGEGAGPGWALKERGRNKVGSCMASGGEGGGLRSSGNSTLRAWASAWVMAEALGKRAAGSLARPRRMTMVKAGGIAGLSSTGEVGVAVTCCCMMRVGLSP